MNLATKYYIQFYYLTRLLSWIECLMRFFMYFFIVLYFERAKENNLRSDA